MKLDVKFAESHQSFNSEFGESNQQFVTNFVEAQSIKGADGKSAYEIAVDNGFEGTEPEWLASLHGKDGKDGYTPKKGVDYFDGAPGKDGKDGRDGADGYTPTKGVDYFDGVNGKDGIDGSNGKDGVDGYTPVKGVDYFTDEDVQSIVNKTAAKLRVIKTSMDAIAVAGAQYYLGEQTAVSVVLPDDAEVGQMVIVCWYNRATAATLSITGTMLGFDYTPSANTRSEINALWDGKYWAVVSHEMEVPAE